MSDSNHSAETPDEASELTTVTTFAMYATMTGRQLRDARWAVEELASMVHDAVDFDREWPRLHDEAVGHGLEMRDLEKPLRTALQWAALAASAELERQIGEIDEVIAERASRANR